MRIVALLSWYNERPDWLAAGVASLAPFADHIIAVDGAYFLYPDGKRNSPSGQAEAIRETARAVGLGCTLFEPQERWLGNEVEKRSLMFRLGETVATPEDWYFVLDGDEVVSDIGCDVKAKCAETQHDCGEVAFWRHRDHYKPEQMPFVTSMVEEHNIRVMFRAIPGLRVEGNHYTYVTPDGRRLWGNPADAPVEPVEDFTDIRIQHRTKERDLWRADEARKYYARRDELNIEGLVR